MRSRPSERSKAVTAALVASGKVVYRRSGGHCEMPGCQRLTDELHHRKLRRHGDHRPVNLMHLCREHHRLVHDNPETSYENGWLVHGYDDPGMIPWTGGPEILPKPREEILGEGAED